MKKETVKKTEQEVMQEFVKKYKDLCDEYGMQIQVTPAWKVSQDTGDWRLVLQSAVARMPKETAKN
jgi:hypothetical protein